MSASGIKPSELKNLLDCCICLRRFQDPRVLPCLHSFCLECLRSHITISAGTNGAFKCPQCRERCVVPRSGPECFPKNFFVNSLNDALPETQLDEASPRGTYASTATDGEPQGVPCKHYKADNPKEHSTPAVVFCVHCDAHFCDFCFKNHGLFNATKDHKIVFLYENKTDGKTEKDEEKREINCKVHTDQKISWHCKTCSLRTCADCIIENHRTHETEKLSAAQSAYKNEMVAIAKLADRRIQLLQESLTENTIGRLKSEDEFQLISKNITDTVSSLCALIKQHEVALHRKVKEAKDVAVQHYTATAAALEKSLDTMSSLKFRAESMQETGPDNAAVQQSQLTKTELETQLEVPVPSVRTRFHKGNVNFGQLSTNVLGDALTKTTVESNQGFQREDIVLEEPSKIIPLGYSGEYVPCGIAPIQNGMLCVAFFEEPDIRVYEEGGQLKELVPVPGMNSVYGIVTTSSSGGKVVLVDGKNPFVHFVTMSPNLKILQHSTRDVPMVPQRASLTHQNQIIVHNKKQKTLAVLDEEGQLLTTVDLQLPHEKVTLESTAQTMSCGYVVCDSENKSVYITGSTGQITNTFNNTRLTPLFVNQTMAGRLLVVDGPSTELRVLGEDGSCLGGIEDHMGSLTYVSRVHVDNQQKLLYVASGSFPGWALNVYKFAPDELQRLPLTRTLTHLNVIFKLMKDDFGVSSADRSSPSKCSMF